LSSKLKLPQNNIINISSNNDNTICKYCNKKLCDRQSRWRHEQKCDKQNNKIDNSLLCRYCTKKYKHIQSRLKHEQKCKSTQLIDSSILKEDIELSKLTSSKNNYPINNHLIDIIIDKSKAIELLKTEIENKKNTSLEINNKKYLNDDERLIEAHKEINLKNYKIQLLEDSFIKKQRRKNYPDKNIIYMITTDDNEKKRTYIIGKTTNLKKRLSNYNKTTEHKVIYYKNCNNEDDMNIIELMVLNKLKNYKEKANRYRFILPLEKDIIFFINIIDSCINFITEINENNIEI